MLTIATFALKGSHDVDLNVTKHIEGIERAAREGAGLVVFPEISLQGYPPLRRADGRAVLADVFETAESIEGPRVSTIADAARDLGLHVVFGMTESTPTMGQLFNAAVLVGPTGVIGRYRKVHLAPWEQVVWRAGSAWPVFATPIGRIGLLICYDQAFPESCRELTLGGAEMLVMPTAWREMPANDPDRQLSEEQYLLYGRARAVDNVRWFISSNYAGDLDGSRYFGHSQIVDPCGRLVAETTPSDGSEMTIAHVDVRGGVEEAYAKGVPPGNRVFRDRRPHTYRRVFRDDQAICPTEHELEAPVLSIGG